MSEKEISTKRASNEVEAKSSASQIAAFLKTARQINPASNGRLIFALDATLSRQPTWDRAMTLQASMFDAVGNTSSGSTGLSVQLMYFRGFGECKASKWVINAAALRDLMTGIECRGGQTQIVKVLSHAAKENSKAKVEALVYIGDAMEEDMDLICAKAGELGLKGTKCFVFQEGNDIVTEKAYREIARLTRGAYFKLGPDSAKILAELFSAIAIYAQGGLKALQTSGKSEAKLLLEQLK